MNTESPIPMFYTKTGSGPAIVLVHGFPASGSLWRCVVDDLVGSFLVIVPDLPGSGRSPLTHKMSLGDMADGIRDILDAERIDTVVLAGHSMGGYIALEFAARYPGRLAGLTLIHTTPAADDEDRKNARLKSIDIIADGGKRLLVSQLVSGLFSPSFKQSHSAIVEQQIDLSLGMPDRCLINFYEAMIQRNDQRTLLKSVSCPVQWVIGTDDNVIFYKKIIEFCYQSGINFVTFIKNCGHMSMLEAPSTLVANLMEFINYCFHIDNQE